MRSTWTALPAPAMLAAFAACHPTTALDPPPVDGAGSVIFAVERWFGSSSVWVFDEESAQYPALEYRGGLDLAAAAYACPPEVLGLTSGLQSLIEPAPELRLPPPDQRLSSRVEGGAQAPWAEDTGGGLLDRALAQLDLPEDALCEIYSMQIRASDISYREVRTSSPAMFGVPLGDGTAFVGTLAGQFFRIGISGDPFRLTNLSTTTPHSAAFRAASGEIWLFDVRTGRVARGHPDRGFEAVEPRLAGRGFGYARAAGATGSAPFEVFLATDARSFERFDGLQFTTLATGMPARDRIRRYEERPSVVWLGPGRALALHVDEQGRLHRYEDGRVTLESGPPELGRLTTLAHVEGFGIVLGGEDGRVARRRDDGTWEVFETGLSSSARAFAPLGGQLLIAGIAGTLTAFAQFQPGVGGCRRDFLVPGFVLDLVPLSRSVLLELSAIGNDDDRNFVRLTRLEALTTLPECLSLP